MSTFEQDINPQNFGFVFMINTLYRNSFPEPVNTFTKEAGI